MYLFLCDVGSLETSDEMELSEKSAAKQPAVPDSASEAESASELPGDPIVIEASGPRKENSDVIVKTEPQQSSAASTPSVHAGHGKSESLLSQAEAVSSLVAGITLFAVIRIFVA